MQVNRLMIVTVCSLFLIQSCTKDTTYTGTIPPTDNPYLLQLDTFTASAIIYRPDSFKTSGNAMLFAGVHKDALFGVVNCTPYFRPTLPSTTPELGNNSYYDSMVLVIKPNKAYYGDTSSLYKLHLYRLSEDLNFWDGLGFYNNESFAVFPNSIGSVAVVYRPNIDDSILVKVSDDLGKELFSLFKSNAATIKDAAVFKDYLKGFRLQPDAANNVIYALPSVDSGLSLQIHYHDDVGKQIQKQFDFGLSNDGNSFTAITSNRASTILSALDIKKETIATDVLVDQELTATKTRINFPNIKDVLKLGSYVKILNASLEIKPVISRYAATYILPPALNLYFYDVAGALSGPLVATTGAAAQTGNLYVDENFGRETSYTFDVTSFINTQLTATNYTSEDMVLVNADVDNLAQLVAGLQGNSLYKTRLVLSLLIYNE